MRKSKFLKQYVYYKQCAAKLEIKFPKTNFASL